VARTGWSRAEQRIEACPLCGSRHLYRQKDFNRALGCLLVLVGAALVPWTYGLSLVVFSLLDLWLYHRLSLAVVCYRCDTVYRDARPTAGQGEFDLLKHDVLKFGKTWQDVETEAAQGNAGAGTSPATPAARRSSEAISVVSQLNESRPK
jgi:hypothetical protein